MTLLKQPAVAWLNALSYDQVVALAVDELNLMIKDHIKCRAPLPAAQTQLITTKAFFALPMPARVAASRWIRGELDNV